MIILSTSREEGPLNVFDPDSCPLLLSWLLSSPELSGDLGGLPPASGDFERLTSLVPWRAAPYVPVEIMLFPRWAPFHLDKVSYWARSTMVPLFILCSMKAKACSLAAEKRAKARVEKENREKEAEKPGGRDKTSNRWAHVESVMRKQFGNVVAMVLEHRLALGCPVGTVPGVFMQFRS